MVKQGRGKAIPAQAPRVFRVNVDCPDDRYPKLKIFISELILDSYDNIPAANVTKHCMI